METKDELELPQIRFPIRGAKTEAELADEQEDREKLSKIVARAFGAIANATGLSDKDVLHTIEDVHVEMLKDVLKDDIKADVLKDDIKADVLKGGIQDAIKDISLATGLETQQISDIFTEKKDANLSDIVNRLYERGQDSRAKFGIGVGNMLSK